MTPRLLVASVRRSGQAPRLPVELLRRAGEARPIARGTGEFRSRVLSAVRRIPPGRVATYGDIAALAGSPRASRAVGNIMRTCREPGVPCHRVIGAGGSLGGYGGNLQMKRELLRAEAIQVRGSRIQNFAGVRWTRTKSTKRTTTR